uniref:Vesicle associated membrane protein 1a n=1 Tax=Cyclopterus lumpus TaxID=8103 RepID=A0A8C2WM03_CYCLU
IDAKDVLTPQTATDGEGGPPAPNLTSNRRLQQTQAQVDEVVDIMRVNVDKVLERDQKLSELDDRADALQAGASQFESSAAKLKNKYWWKNCKPAAIHDVTPPPPTPQYTHTHTCLYFYTCGDTLHSRVFR